MSELPVVRHSRHSPLRLSELPGFRNFAISQTESAESDLGIHWISSRISRIRPFWEFIGFRAESIESAESDSFWEFVGFRAESTESAPADLFLGLGDFPGRISPLSQNLAIPRVEPTRLRGGRGGDRAAVHPQGS